MMDPLRLQPKKKSGKPQQQQQEGEAERAPESIMPARQQHDDEGEVNQTLIGYRTPAALRGKASFLVGMGRKLQEEEGLK